MKKYQYYIELIDNEDAQPILQSRWFDTKKEAKDWYYENIDDIDEDKISAEIMTAALINGGEGGYDIIKNEGL